MIDRGKRFQCLKEIKSVYQEASISKRKILDKNLNREISFPLVPNILFRFHWHNNAFDLPIFVKWPSLLFLFTYLDFLDVMISKTL